MTSDEFKALDFNSARRYAGGINKYLFDFINYVNEHGGGDTPVPVGSVDYNTQVTNRPVFVYPNHDSITLAGSHGLADYFIESLDNKTQDISEERTADNTYYPTAKAVKDYVKDKFGNFESKENKVESVQYGKSIDEDKKDYLSVHAYKNDIHDRFDSINQIHVFDKDVPLPKFYVGFYGNDSNSGLDYKNALATIGKMNDIAYDELQKNVVLIAYPEKSQYVQEIATSLSKNLILISRTNEVSYIQSNRASEYFRLQPGVSLEIYNLWFVDTYDHTSLFIKHMKIVNDSDELLGVDTEYLKNHQDKPASLKALATDTSNNYNEYVYVNDKYEKVGVDDYNDLENRVRLDGQLLSSSSTMEELNIQPKLVSDDSEGKQNLKTINGEILTGKGNIVISGSGEASTYASLPDKPELEGHALNSGNNTLEDLGIAGLEDLNSLDTEVNVLATELNTAKNDIVTIKDNTATSFDKSSTSKSPSCKAVADYIDTVLADLDGSEEAF